MKQIDNLPIAVKSLLIPIVGGLALLVILAVFFGSYRQVVAAQTRTAQAATLSADAAQVLEDLGAAHIALFRALAWKQVGVNDTYVDQSSQQAANAQAAVAAGLERLNRDQADPAMMARLESARIAYDRAAAQTADFIHADLYLAAMSMTDTNEKFLRLRDAAGRLAAMVAVRSARAQAETVTAMEHAMTAVFGVTLAALLASALAAVLISRTLSGPIEGMTRIMTQLSRGDVSVEIPDLERRDEIGAMAAAVEVFKYNLERNAELEEASRRDRLREHDARLAAEAANRSKSLFLANMSHELRTPLNAILGFSQLMERDEAITEAQRDTLAIIRRSGEHLLSLINDILDMAKIEAGRVTLAPEDFDLPELITDLGEMIRHRAESKGLSFSLDQGRDLPRFVHADPGKLRQILINLLGNAVKYTDQGGFVLRAHPLRGESWGETQRHWVRFEIEDSGRGVAEADLERIFDPFVQVGRSVGSTDGTGLGLPITKQFIGLLGGVVRVTSVLGEGSTFIVDLPLVQGQPVRPSVKQPRVVGLEPGQPECRVLVVDDSQPNRLLLSRLLQCVGVVVREAADGQEAVSVAEQWRPHLIWMDLRMPRLDGYEATRRIKQSAASDAVVVALTASIFADERGKVLQAGCAELVRKPFHEEVIFEVMERQLGLRFVRAAPEPVPAPAAAAAEADPAADFQSMSIDMRTQLRQAVRAGDLAAIHQVEERLSALNPAWGQRVKGFTRSFRYRQLLDALDHEEAPS